MLHNCILADDDFDDSVLDAALAQASGDIVTYRSPASAGNFLLRSKNNSALLNQQIKVQAIADNADDAEVITYEAKRAGVEVLGIAQSGAKFILELGGLAAAIMTLIHVTKNFSTYMKDGKTIASGSKWIKGGAAVMGVASAGLLAKYAYDRLKQRDDRSRQDTLDRIRNMRLPRQAPSQVPFRNNLGNQPMLPNLKR